jgi:hypothetical protein
MYPELFSEVRKSTVTGYSGRGELEMSPYRSNRTQPLGKSHRYLLTEYGPSADEL